MPGTHCNRGEARPGQVLAEVCVIPVDGIRWALVHNRANGHTGFINALRLKHADPPTHCNDVGRFGIVAENGPLHQCPEDFCNRGEATNLHHLRLICHIGRSDGTAWVWMFNRTNHHEGFYHVSGSAGLPVC
ncbi:hypothetical protein LFM09_07265 [Lentzea alba]|uniref:hypothetical protein n=1 Tax=Lentzea alba TaxID=2714351 RepID=UPI0039BF79AB